MSGRLVRIEKWETLARQADFHPAQMAALCSISLRQLERFFALRLVVMNVNAMTFVAPNLACGEAQWPRAAPRSGAVTDEQRSHRPNSAQPAGRQVFFAQTSLRAPYRSTVGYARRSRLVWAKNPLPRTSSHLRS